MISRLRATVLGMTAVASLASALAASGRADTAQSLAVASIGRQVVLREISPMRFGIMRRPAERESVELTPFSTTVNGGLTRAGRAHMLAASITLQGTPNQTFSIALPVAARMGQAATMIHVTTFTHDAGRTPVIDAGGMLRLRIGATLLVSGQTPSGRYAGSFDVIVANN